MYSSAALLYHSTNQSITTYNLVVDLACYFCPHRTQMNRHFMSDPPASIPCRAAGAIRQSIALGLGLLYLQDARYIIQQT
jgi:hypothetical protein